MTDADFLAMMRHTGLDPTDHDTNELRTAYLRLTDLFAHLETREDRAKAQGLPVFDPGKPL